MTSMNFNPMATYKVDEEFFYDKTYLFIKGYAVGKNLSYTLKALPLAEQIHKEQYRKGEVHLQMPNGDMFTMKLPYLFHVLKVASTLISLNLPLTNEELDTLIASAILHDSIEDAPKGFFRNGGYELVTEYGFSKEIYDIVKLVSKRAGATEAELDNYFYEISKNKFALLIKMADRSHNVEDLYVMKIEKLHKYVIETRRWVYPLSSYAKAHYPELSNGVTILKAKIVSLTEATETIVDMYEEEIEAKDKEIEALKKELETLKSENAST